MNQDKKKVTKKAFEYELWKKHGEYQYDIHIGTYLYYKDGKHVASWEKGFGWEF